MSLTTFHRFPSLSTELQNKIWQFAISFYILKELVPQRLRIHRQCDLSKYLNRLDALARICSTSVRMHLRDPYNGQKIRLEEDELEGMVNGMTISAVCDDARLQVAEFCRSLVPTIILEYDTDESESLALPQKDEECAFVRSVDYEAKAESLEHVFPRPTRVSVRGPGQFKSAEHMVETVRRFCGSKIQRLTLDDRFGPEDLDVRDCYWGEVGELPKKVIPPLHSIKEPNPTIFRINEDRQLESPAEFWKRYQEYKSNYSVSFNPDLELEPVSIHIKENKGLHITKRVWYDDYKCLEDMSVHLLRMYEVISAAREKLLDLQTIRFFFRADDQDLRGEYLGLHNDQFNQRSSIIDLIMR